jgi:hypothetical protein
VTSGNLTVKILQARNTAIKISEPSSRKLLDIKTRVVKSVRIVNDVDNTVELYEFPRNLTKYDLERSTHFRLGSTYNWKLYDTGSVNALSIVIPALPALTSWTQLIGVKLLIRVKNTNTGVVTVAINGLSGSKSVKKSGTQELLADDLLADTNYEFVYDGTSMQAILITQGQELFIDTGAVFTTAIQARVYNRATSSYSTFLTFNEALGEYNRLVYLSKYFLLTREYGHIVENIDIFDRANISLGGTARTFYIANVEKLDRYNTMTLGWIEE